MSTSSLSSVAVDRPRDRVTDRETGFLAWLPFIYPSMQTPAVEKTGPAIGFVGGMLFEVGSYLMVCEALDR